MNRGEIWSFIRNVLSQGMAIQMDVQAGKYKDTELVHCRLDEAARERVDELERLLSESEGSHNA